jgi:hypothetical protein
MMNRLLHNKLWIVLLTMTIFWNAKAQNAAVTGKVTDQNGSEIPGVSVSVKGTSQGTSTNEKGEYSISVASGGTLVFSFIGFKRMEMNVTSQKVMNVTMQTDVSVLDEVVVTALGQTQEKRAIGYSVQSIKSDEIRNSGNPNMIGALQGKVAGAVITGSGGAPGAGVNIILRGITSLSGSADNQPLICHRRHHYQQCYYGRKPASQRWNSISRVRRNNLPIPTARQTLTPTTLKAYRC